MDDDRFSSGSTVSGIFNTALQAPDPIGFVYISHPFGAPASPTSNDYYQSLEFLQIKTPLFNRQTTSISFNKIQSFPESYQCCNSKISRQSIKFNKKHTTFDNQLIHLESSKEKQITKEEKLLPKQKRTENIKTKISEFRETPVPELRLIFETLRNVWKSPKSSFESNEHIFENNVKKNIYNDPYRQRIKTNLPPYRPKVFRRYSVPEIEIRRFNIIQQFKNKPFTKETHNKNFERNIQNQNNMKNSTFEKSIQRNPQNYGEKNILTKPKLKICSPNLTYLDLVCNRRNADLKFSKKPFSMPHENTSFKSRESNPKNIDIQKEIKKSAEQEKNKKNKSTIDNNSKESPSTSDVFISELLIKNLNDDVAVADLLMWSLNYDENFTKTIAIWPETKKEISSVYITPERIHEIVSRGSKCETKDQELYQQFIKLPDAIGNFEDEKTTVDKVQIIPSEQNSNENDCDKNKSLSMYPLSSKSDESSELLKSVYSPIDSLDFEKSLLAKVCPENSFENDETSSHALEIVRKSIDLNIQSFLQESETSFLEGYKANKYFKLGKTVSKRKTSSVFQNQSAKVSSRRKKSKVDETVVDSLETYTFDAKGNLNFQKTKTKNKNKKEKKQENHSAIKSRYVCVSAASSVSNKSNKSNNLKKITIFEAQSNIVTPDNEMGPKRFYQKTEILDGDKKIDILEIVECLHSPFNRRKKNADFYSKHSKIPVRVKESQNLGLKDFRSQKTELITIKSKQKPKTNVEILDLNTIESKFTHIEINNKAYNKKNCPNGDSIKNISEKIGKIESTSKRSNKSNNEDKQLTRELSTIKEIKFERSNESEGNKDDTNENNMEDILTISIPSTVTALHGSSQRKNSSEIFLNSNSSKTAYESPEIKPGPKIFERPLKHEPMLLMSSRKFNEIVNVKPMESRTDKKFQLQTKFNNRQELKCNDTKLDAWRIPSSDFYKACHSFQNREILDFRKTDENFKSELHNSFSPSSCENISHQMTNVCEKCRKCSCYSGTSNSNQTLYSPTLSVCSICCRRFSPSFCPENFNCNNTRNILTRDKCHATNKSSENKKFSGFAIQQKQKQLESNSEKTDCIYRNKSINCVNKPFRSELMRAPTECPRISKEYCTFYQRADFCKKKKSSGRLLNSSSSVTSSECKTPNLSMEMPCNNWKSTMDDKIPPIKIHTTQNHSKPEANIINDSVWTVTVSGSSFDKTPSLKMELNFLKGDENKDKTILELENETSQTSPCSTGTIHEKILPSDYTHNQLADAKGIKKINNDEIENEIVPDTSDCSGEVCEYALNFSNFLRRKHYENGKNLSKLSVLGNSIAPEQKPKVASMTERDLTRRHRKQRFM